MTREDARHAVAAICLTILGSAFLIVAGLWPETTPAVTACAIIGWALTATAFSQYQKIGRS
jgi:hypothetical protein